MAWYGIDMDVQRVMYYNENSIYNIMYQNKSLKEIFRFFFFNIL